MKISAKKLGLLLMFTYMISYLTRINYGAVISEMVSATSFSKTELSIAVTGAFITYGVGQIISGFFGDRINPKRLVLMGLITTVCMNILLPLCGNLYLMIAVWCVNGFAQAFMWPPMVRLMTAAMTPDEYRHETVTVSLGSSAGTILIYLITPLVITVADWRFSFWFSAACGVAMIFIWQKLCPDVDTVPKSRNASESVAQGSAAKILFSPVMLVIMLCIILQGILRDGVTTWMPSYISETYNLGNNISILTGVMLPLFSILSFKVTERLYGKVIKNPMTCAGTVFGVGGLAALAVVLVTGHSSVLSVASTAVLTGCMHGVNLMLICMIPAFFANSGRVSLISGVLNACTYVGSALSTYGVAKIAEEFGWSVTVGSWLVCAVLGTFFCFVIAPIWKRKYMN